MVERFPQVSQMNYFVDYQLSRKSKTEYKIKIHSLKKYLLNAMCLALC